MKESLTSAASAQTSPALQPPVWYQLRMKQGLRSSCPSVVLAAMATVYADLDSSAPKSLAQMSLMGCVSQLKTAH